MGADVVPVIHDGFASTLAEAEESKDMCLTHPAALDALAKAVGRCSSRASSSSRVILLEGFPKNVVTTKHTLTSLSCSTELPSQAKKAGGGEDGGSTFCVVVERDSYYSNSRG